MSSRTQSAVAAADLAPGTRFAGYRIDRVGPSEDARWTMTDATAPDGRAVRLAVSTPAAADHAPLRERVRRLERLAELTAPPLLAPIAAGHREDRLYVVLAPDDAPTLADRLRAGPLSCAEAVKLVGRVAGGLETLRSVGLPRGIVTPRQVVLVDGRPAQALLTGYAFALPSARPHDGHSTVEQADYLAPEVAAGAPAGTAAVVYALACVLVECLTGRPPFPEDRPLLVLRAHATKRPPRVSSRADVPPALDAVVITALSKRPDRRQPSALAFAQAVQHAVGGRVAPPVGSVVAELPGASPLPRRTDLRPAGPRPAVARRPVPARAELDASAPRAATAPLRAPRRASAPVPAPRPPAALPRVRPGRPVPGRAGLAVGVAVVLASAAGLAAAGLGGGSPAAPSVASRAPAVAGAPPAYVRSLNGALARLSAARVAGRLRLRTAPSARAQVAAATALAQVYRDARADLPPAPAGVEAASGLGTVLGATASAYDRLATAVRQGDAVGYAALGDALARDEGALQQQLRRLG